MTEYARFRYKNRGYMTLRVWHKAVDLYKLVCRIVYTDNKIDFKLRSQIADAAQSVSANISDVCSCHPTELKNQRQIIQLYTFHS
jgi:four helix bundle protein